MSEPSAKRIRILAADDHTMLREVLCSMLQREPDLTVVAQASDGPETVRLIEETQPDVILLDLEMPGPGISATLHEINAVLPSARVIVVSMHDDSPLVQSLIGEGAVGFVHKCAPYEFLLTAVRSAMSGGKVVYIPQGAPPVASPLPPAGVLPEPQAYLEEPRPRDEGGATEAGGALTPREQEVLLCVAEAMSNRQIGRRLGIAEATVKRHLRSTFAKLDANSRLDAVNKGIAMGVMRR
ncbi:response regulator [Streptomyces sp. NPDC055400]